MIGGNGVRPPALTDDLFRLFADWIRSRSGIEFSEANRYLLEKRLQRRAEELGLDSLTRYYHRLKYDSPTDAEADRILDLISNPETYFFREPEQLAAFADEIVPELLRKGPPEQGALRIWSAGCATGEEPYTIAMLLEERGIFARVPVDIFASDIAGAALTRARDGTYRETSFRQIPEGIRERFFHQESPGRWRIDDAIRQRVTFGRVNLVEEAHVASLPAFDVIFCRNVLIYFGEPWKRRAVALLHGRLREGGYLLLGHAESLISVNTAFHLRHLVHDLVYQR
jgi:chemotaxis protein methyltransferase CheR